MTAMPQMVALFNGMGGGSAALIAAQDFRTAVASGTAHPDITWAIMVSCIIGSLSFAGSLVAFAKLQELMPGRPLTYRLQSAVNGLLLLVILALGVYLIVGDQNLALFAVFIVLSLLLGVLFVVPIGGADMPVIISLLNSFTGLAAASTGFVLSNDVLIVSGALVGASGTILTLAMSKAMNRSLFNVLFSGFGSKVESAGSAAGAEGGTIHPTTVEDLAPLLAFAQLVIFVPGYGMAVARAQHEVKELADELEKRGVTVEYAIHPVAGRMPGHMNVLLAEANVPYPQLKEMDAVNGDFPAHRRRGRHRRQRRRQPGGAHPDQQPDLRHADPRRRPGEDGGRPQAEHGDRIRRRRQPVVLQAEHADALRRRAYLGGGARRRGQEAVVGGAFPVDATLRSALSRSAGAVSLTT